MAKEKMSKYVDLQIECQKMWNKKVEVIPMSYQVRSHVKASFPFYFIILFELKGKVLVLFLN